MLELTEEGIKMLCKENTEIYNKLPLETRKIANIVSAEYQIRDLLIERDRAISAHRSHLRKIDDHLKACRRSLKEAVIDTYLKKDK